MPNRGGPRIDDELAVRKHLKVFIGNLPMDASDGEVGRHFEKCGQVLHVSLIPREGTPYAFATFKFAADADCAVMDRQYFTGCQKPLNMNFATPKKGSDAAGTPALNEWDPCKVFVGGIGDRDMEEELGDFFSQWGMVILIYRDKSWGFVTFATKEAAMRLLDEKNIIFRKRRLDVKSSESKKSMDEGEREDLVKRAVARHFHKKTAGAPAPAHPGYPPQGYPGYPPQGGHPGYPPQGQYGAPPPGYPPQGQYGAPPPGYPPQGGYAPPGYPPQGGYPPQDGYYGGQAPPGQQPAIANDPYARPASDPYARPPAGGDPYARPPAGGDPYARPPAGSDPYARPPAGSDPYARDPYAGAPSAGSAPPPHHGAPPADPYRQHGAPPEGGHHGAAPSSYPPRDPYYGQPAPTSAYGGNDPYAAAPAGQEQRYRPY